MRETIHHDHELTPAALRLVASVEARDQRAGTKAKRLEVLKEAGNSVQEKLSQTRKEK
jgi:hypothetical protein